MVNGTRFAIFPTSSTHTNIESVRRTKALTKRKNERTTQPEHDYAPARSGRSNPRSILCLTSILWNGKISAR